MIRVAFYGARPLGQMCLYELSMHPGVEVVGAHLDSAGWWGLDDTKILEDLGLQYLNDGEFRQADLVFSVLTSHIFTRSEIEDPQFGVINLHLAPLPEYRGCNGCAHAIMNGDKTYGVSLHYIDEGIDTGPVIARGHFPVSPDEVGRTLYEKAQLRAYRLFCEELPTIVENARNGKRVPARDQRDFGDVARYYRRDSLSDKSLAGLDPAARERKIRALTFPPFPPAHE